MGNKLLTHSVARMDVSRDCSLITMTALYYNPLLRTAEPAPHEVPLFSCVWAAAGNQVVVNGVSGVYCLHLVILKSCLLTAGWHNVVTGCAHFTYYLIYLYGQLIS